MEYLITTVVIVYIKSTQDILQGLNKLDYLLKYSVFQKYKCQPSDDGPDRQETIINTSVQKSATYKSYVSSLLVPEFTSSIN